MPLYINRYSRRRHVDPNCRGIRLSDEMAAESAEWADRGRPIARILEIPDPTDPGEVQATRDFTYPCVWCVPGARESWDARPIEFEHRDEIDPGTDWTDLAIVVRNEPSPSHAGWVQVVARTHDGGEYIIDQTPEPVRPGTLVSLYGD